MALMERVMATKDDPLAFVLTAYPWGVPGTPLAGMKGPRPWQREELEHLSQYLRTVVGAHGLGLDYEIYRLAMSSGRGPGKSALLAWIAHWQCSTHWGSQTIVAANTETQLRSKTFPEIARWVSMSIHAHWFEIEGMKIMPSEWLTSQVADQQHIDKGYWNIVGQNWSEDNPDAFAGAHNQNGLAVLFDEASGIAPPIWTNADGFFTDKTPYRFFMAMSQMRRSSGYFYDLFYNAVAGRGWRTRMLDIRSMPELDQAWVRSFIERSGGADTDAVRVEIRGMPPKGGDSQFIAADVVDAAVSRVIPHSCDHEPLIMGVDPAPRGRTLIRFRQGWNARDCCGKDTRVELNGKNNVEIAKVVADLYNKYKPDALRVDFGMGTGVIDVLRAVYKIQVGEVKFGETPHDTDSEWATHGTELWARLRDWLETGLIDNTPELKRDLTARHWKWSGREDNKKILETKEDLKARGIPSPDDADALGCTFDTPPSYRLVRRPEGQKVRIAEGTDTWMVN